MYHISDAATVTSSGEYMLNESVGSSEDNTVGVDTYVAVCELSGLDVGWITGGPMECEGCRAGSDWFVTSFFILCYDICSMYIKFQMMIKTL